MNKIIVVYCDPDTQLSRLMRRNDYTKEEALQRITAQLALNEKCQWATHVVDNSRSSAETMQQVEKIHKELTSSWAFLRVRIAFVTILAGIALACCWVIQWIW
ncbi:dephospho- kinase domain-containing [Paramuricea clavata]|uniref:Dephospho- kinase domain-containing n=1 Tax=Paramuricea clavata TaxID=317549 RepID=A0A7D9JD83_PARCT|nr:dephospho- kinase domain-containing [Paramuricea clavata]